ncbi:MAG TPA: Smr/MutS family protein [Allosphingosinicella sp.]|nr:Smr/MutS family protein [Allosphingosinicella sp.]
MRRLSAEERALWRKVVESVRPFHEAVEPREAPAPAAPKPPPARPAPAAVRTAAPGTTLDGTWDRRLSRGLVQPDRTLDLHGHSLATAYGLLDHRLEQAIAAGNRVLLLITGKPRSGGERRGAIRAAVGDWLAASRHAADIAAVRNAHPRHGGAGALYIVLRKRRERS